MKTTPLNEAIRLCGSMESLASRLGLTRAAIWQWSLEGRKVPAEHCPRIERITGGAVRCEALRPDVDWEYLRGGKKSRALRSAKGVDA